MTAHSATIRLELHAAGRILPIAQLGPDFLVLALQAISIPATAEILVAVDGYESRWPVRIGPGGICCHTFTRLRIENIGDRAEEEAD